MERTDDFVRKTQSICKVFRSIICDMTLEQMSHVVHVDKNHLSAWEDGKTDKVEYLFYYYDILDEVAKKQFIDAVFHSDGKTMAVDILDMDGDNTSYAIRWL